MSLLLDGMKAEALQWLVRMQGFTVLDQSVVSSEVASSSLGLIIYLWRRTLGKRESLYGHTRGGQNGPGKQRR